jgi:branched-chain amino acid transport system ATP-binding protein
MSRALELTGIDAGYGPVQALFTLSLPVAEGKVTAVLGPNGAGKTTSLRVAAGLLPAIRGSVTLRGAEVTGKPPRQIARSGMCLIPEGRGTFPSLTVRENLLLQCPIAGKKMSQVEEVAYGRFPVLGKRRSQIAGTLSGGEQHMLALSRALTTDPQVILIDEISMGLAPIIVEQLFDQVAGIAAEGRTIVLVEQLAELVLEIADFAAVISKGAVVTIGQPADVRHSLEEIYLGADVRAEAGTRVTDDDRRWKTPVGTLSHAGDCPVVIRRPDALPVADGDDLADCGICGAGGPGGICGTASTSSGPGETAEVREDTA